MTMRVVEGSGFLLDWVRAAQDGSLMPAAFQRPYSWGREDVEALWKSIVKGWPTGSILLWECSGSIDPAAAGRGRLGPVERDEGDWDHMLLDGQNRLASLAWSLLHPDSERPDPSVLGEAEAETWGDDAALVMDPDLGRVLFVPADEAGEGFRMPVAAALDMRLLRREVTRIEEATGEEVPDRILAWVDSLGNAVCAARTATVVLERASAAEAVEAFAHIARAGVPVSEEDVRAALSWTEGPRPSRGMRP